MMQAFDISSMITPTVDVPNRVACYGAKAEWYAPAATPVVALAELAVASRRLSSMIVSAEGTKAEVEQIDLPAGAVMGRAMAMRIAMRGVADGGARLTEDHRARCAAAVQDWAAAWGRWVEWRAEARRLKFLARDRIVQYRARVLPRVRTELAAAARAAARTLGGKWCIRAALYEAGATRGGMVGLNEIEKIIGDWCPPEVNALRASLQLRRYHEAETAALARYMPQIGT